VERKFRLTQTTEFMRVRRCGKSYAHPLLVLIVQANSLSGIRVGISASHSVGNAVQRNRAKRRLRACLTELLPQIHPGFDIVILARKAIDQAGFSELRAAVSHLLGRAGLLGVIKNDG
jgi:ribonuclease P protein component